MPNSVRQYIFGFSITLIFFQYGCENLDKVITADNTPPTVVITSPANNSILTGPTEIKIDVTDNKEVYKIEYLIDGILSSVDSISPFEYTWDPGFLADDDFHTILVRAYDQNNNVGQSNLVSIKIPTALSVSPIIVSPTPLSLVDSDYVKITWLKVQSARSYDLEIANDESFNNIIFSAQSIIDTTIITSKLIRSTYYIRIRAVNTLGFKTSWSNTLLFYTIVTSFSEVFGGSSEDNALYAIQLNDGKYLFCGITKSYGLGTGDGWLIKTNSTGKQLWSKTYGGVNEDRINFIAEVKSGGYLLGGYTRSKGNGGEDAFLIKTDTSGNVLWEKLFGGIGDDAVLSICIALDGSFYLTGYTSSYTDFYQAWVIKTDPNGNELWKNMYGGTGGDFGQHIKEVNGEFVISGVNGSVPGNSYDFWLFKIGPEGNLIWNKTFGTTADERSIKFTDTPDGGIVVTGYTYISGNMDIWLVKTNSEGIFSWEKKYGSTGNDFGFMVTTTSNSGFAISGYTTQNGDQNAWLIKTDANGNELWNKKFGGQGTESASSVHETKDHGLLLGCWTSSLGAGNNDFWLIKTDELGNIK